MPIKSFRGQIKNDAKEIISLHTNTGSTGYRIRKFEVMPKQPEGATEEALLKIWTNDVSAIADIGVGTVDFSDPSLLAAAFYSGSAAASTNPEDTTVVFDNMTFNQDIYLTCKSSGSMNYHIELEQIKLDINQNTVATLKDIRNITGQ